MPRLLPDGSRNRLHLVRAKDKMGDRSNCGAEVELAGSLAYPVGEEGRGIPTAIEMATYTRLDCANGSAGIMRAALSNALHHASRRAAFSQRLIGRPLMRNVLADMALEVKAHIALAMRVSGAFDRQADPREDALRRVITPVAKYWITKRCPVLVAGAMEVLGGIGYIEEAPLARLYRQAPLNSIWEGSGNIMSLDLLRALSREPDTLPALEAELTAQLAGSGNFKVRDKPQRPGKNPKTGEEIPITARRVVTFHASQKLKAAVEKSRNGSESPGS